MPILAVILVLVLDGVGDSGFVHTCILWQEFGCLVLCLSDRPHDLPASLK